MNHLFGHNVSGGGQGTQKRHHHDSQCFGVRGTHQPVGKNMHMPVPWVLTSFDAGVPQKTQKTSILYFCLKTNKLEK